MVKKEKIHVCHLVYSFDIGGLERVIANCIGALDKNAYRHSIIALTEVGEFISEIDGVVEHYSLNKKSGHDFFIHLKLYKILKKIRPDVLHSYNLSTIEYQWLTSFLDIQLRIHAEHGRDSYDMNGTVKKYQLLRRVMSPFIDHFVTVSQDLHHWLRDDVLIPEKKLLLITNGIDTDYYRPDNIKPERKGIYEGKFIFGHVSRLHPIKNQEFLIESFNKACFLSPSFRESCLLIIVGDGPDKDKLKKLVDNNEHLKDKIIFTGSKSNVREYYSIFDVFVMSSLAEGVPMTLLESMSMGVPHLVTSVGGITEVVEEGITGISLCDKDKDTYHEKMIELFENKNNLSTLSQNSRLRVTSSYSQNKMVGSYNKIYKTVCI
ncbi:glycosyltransferase [Vibrio japonicus]|uniref:Glycosyltransferase n=1 Tax=Vibrio japonicus TaxID=1824638 RepID=A0ABY5LMW7_9VIBR|nr:glycosyltransferase [Vibrio japonicus]UUM32250.1 glycosyltransferase [Vibrio japonicus]